MKPQAHDAEALALLKKIIEGQAYRQLMLANIRGHGIKFLPDLEAKIAVAKVLDTSLQQFRDVVRLYDSLGLGDVVSAVRGKMERIPFPASRVELALCLFLCEGVKRRALQAYTNSTCKDFAAIALTRLDEMRDLELPEDPVVLEFCSDPANRPHAQQLLNRWLSITLLSLGRPGSAGDARAVALGLRSEPVADIVRDFITGLKAFLDATGLAFPSAQTLGVELPPLEVASRRSRA